MPKFSYYNRYHNCGRTFTNMQKAIPKSWCKLRNPNNNLFKKIVIDKVANMNCQNMGEIQI